jgi:hypothetical protein
MKMPAKLLNLRGRSFSSLVAMPRIMIAVSLRLRLAHKISLTVGSQAQTAENAPAQGLMSLSLCNGYGSPDLNIPDLAAS